MNITKQLKSVSRKFVLTTIGLSVASVAILAAILYGVSAISFSDSVSSEKLHSVVEDHDAVVEYLEQEKASEAHFVTIASLIKEDQQRSLGEALLAVTVPVVVVAGALGFVAARFLLRPVKESYEARERFLQDAAHELRNPLAAMSLALENTRATSADTDLHKTMSRQTKRLVRINEDLLYLERSSTGKEIAEVNASSLLEDLLEDLHHAIKVKGLNLKTKIQPDVMVTMDPNDFIKLARNIIENSIKYTKRGKSIAVSLSHNKHLELIVKDQGIGISEADLERVGERFFRASNVSKISGSGLGIAIVQKVLNSYGGSMDIQSKTGVGTTVTIKI